jgi:hypothetical protein
MDLLIMSARAI